MRKRGQVTVFIIVGVMMLFVFGFLFMLSGSLQKKKLIDLREQVVFNAFQKEGLRLFVEDCLSDHLEEGLLLLGKQGTIWKGQPGGIREFVDGKTGVVVGTDKVFYGLRYEPLEPAEAYPCKDAEHAPAFCQYKYPQTNPETGVFFGKLELRKETAESDLRRFMIEKTRWCVENFLKEKVSSAARLEASPLDLKLKLQEEGIAVDVKYPLKFAVGDEDYFYLSTFDFVYPSSFLKVFNAAVRWPLEQDHKFVDFRYTGSESGDGQSDMFKSVFEFQSDVDLDGAGNDCTGHGLYRCRRSTQVDTYRSLGIQMQTEENSQGDDIFTFIPAAGTVVHTDSGQFMFRFARQNRPPAMEYVERNKCLPDYDYLVLKGGAEGYGDIDITLKAQDPDEDADLRYSFQIPQGWPASQPPNPPEKLSITSLSSVQTGIYNVKAGVSDGHLEDKQNIKVLVDDPVTVEMTPHYVYSYKDNQNRDIAIVQSDGKYVISREDPIKLQLTLTDNSPVNRIPETSLQFQYNTPNQAFSFTRNNIQACTIFPHSQACSSNVNFRPENLGDSEGIPVREFEKKGTGTITLTHSVTYCGNTRIPASLSKQVDVVDCVPHKNLEHQYPYMPDDTLKLYQLKWAPNQQAEYTPTEQRDANLNPFSATHTCCKENAELEGRAKICFVNPVPGCYGQIRGLLQASSNNYGHYIMETMIRKCDNSRGNMCAGEYDNMAPEWKCGSNGHNQCSGIAQGNDYDCQNKPSYSIIDGKGWCCGTMGCENFCAMGQNKEIAYFKDLDDPRRRNRNFENHEIAQKAQQYNAINDRVLRFPFKYDGCPSSNPTDDEIWCDPDFDGCFDGNCDIGGGCRHVQDCV